MAIPPTNAFVGILAIRFMKQINVFLLSVLISAIFVSGCENLSSNSNYLHIELNGNHTSNDTFIKIPINVSLANNSNSSLHDLYNSYLNGTLNYTNTSNTSWSVGYPGGHAYIYAGGSGEGGPSGVSSGNNQAEAQAGGQGQDYAQALKQSGNESQWVNDTQTGDNNQTSGTSNNNYDYNLTLNATEDGQPNYGTQNSGTWSNDTNQSGADQSFNDSLINNAYTQEDQNNTGNNDDSQQNDKVGEIPEFTTIGAALVLSGAGVFIYCKRKNI